MTNKALTDDFYKYFSSKQYTKLQNDKIKQQELFGLFKTPKKDKPNEVPKNMNIHPKTVFQADVLYMPEDPATKYKYILVVVDTANGQTDGIPLLTRDTVEVVEAFKEAFKKLGTPSFIQVDSGSEFLKDVKRFFKDNKIAVKTSKVGRSRQVSYAENRNEIITKALFMRMTAQELLTNESSLEWVDDLKHVLKAINQEAIRTFNEKKKRIEKYDEPIFTKGNEDLLQFDEKVRIQLDKPVDVMNRKLHGNNFRATDIRWSTQVYHVFNIILQDGQPPMYIVALDNKPLPVGYTRNQLQVVEGLEKPPNTVIRAKPKPVIETETRGKPKQPIVTETRGKPKQPIVTEIVGKRMLNNRVQYLTKFEGFVKPKYISRQELILNEDAKKLMILKSSSK